MKVKKHGRSTPASFEVLLPNCILDYGLPSFPGFRLAHSGPTPLLPDGMRLRERERPDPFRKFDDVFELVVVTHQPVTDTTAGADDQARYPDKGVKESFKLHAHHREP